MNKKVAKLMIICIPFVLLLFVNSSCTLVSDENSDQFTGGTSENNLYDKALKTYSDFFAGKVDARSEHGKLSVNDSDVFQFDQKKLNKYAFYDMNGDGIPELLLWSSRLCYILAIEDSKLVVWYETTHYSKILNSGNELITVENMAPNHVSYEYNIFDNDGNIKHSISFEKYDDDNNGIYDEKDLYYFDNTSVGKSVWDALTKPYLNESDDKIVWIKYEQRTGTQGDDRLCKTSNLSKKEPQNRELVKMENRLVKMI